MLELITAFALANEWWQQNATNKQSNYEISARESRSVITADGVKAGAIQ